MFGAMGCILLAAILGKFWLALLAVMFAMPAAWLFNLQCRKCSWPVYRAFGSAKQKYQRDQLLAPLNSKILWNLPAACTKCGTDFSGTDPVESF
ncbi:hypothetical protein [Altererythrobacter xiamenensis]|uniref:hypothetical protein n=1 Tax=Altererythrobacter xiamenensis TaxID=1316679 RepID=UPI001178084B|nr:hypothetical protein [Altererythrobacter xiamenensis]